MWHRKHPHLMLHQINRICLFAASVVQFIATVLFVSATVLMFVNVILRYIFHQPLFWGDEITIFLMIWALLLGGALQTLKNTHLRIDFIDLILSNRAKKYKDTVSHLLEAIIAVIMVWASYKFIGGTIIRGLVAPASNAPLWIPFTSVLVAFSVVTLFAINNIFKK